jgi:hypothetical protein
MQIGNIGALQARSGARQAAVGGGPGGTTPLHRTGAVIKRAGGTKTPDVVRYRTIARRAAAHHEIRRLDALLSGFTSIGGD